MAKKEKRKKSKILISSVLLLTVIITALTHKFIISYLYFNNVPDNPDNSTSRISLSNSEPDFISSDMLNSPSAILLSLENNVILMRKNSQEKIYPASLTKMMTAIVAIENLSDLNEEIELNNSIYKDLYEANASMAGFQPGEQVSAIDLLYGALLPSGAECCVGLACYIAGSEKAFVDMMNQKASELDMDNTHFENTTGLHNEKHYTSVEDLAALLSYALKNDIFRKIFTSSRHSTGSTNKHPGGITYYSTMFQKLININISGGDIIGGKTGYTEEAGLCLASLAKVGEEEYIFISVGAEGNPYTEQYNITDALTVYRSIKNNKNKSN